jgi:ribonuclease P protein component
MDTAHHRMHFPRSTRLKSPSQIRRICRQGRRRVGKRYTIHWQYRNLQSGNTAAGPDVAGVARLAFVVSKRLGKAQVRNRIKRRLREAARLNRSCWPAGTDIVFRATEPDIATVPFTALLAEVKASLGKTAGRT